MWTLYPLVLNIVNTSVGAVLVIQSKLSGVPLHVRGLILVHMLMGVAWPLGQESAKGQNYGVFALETTSLRMYRVSVQTKKIHFDGHYLFYKRVTCCLYRLVVSSYLLTLLLITAA